MSGSSTRRVWASAVALVLACMAIALRVLVPQGYMVAPNAQPGTFPIVLCTSQGAETLYIDEAGHVVRSPSKGPADHSGDQKGEYPCAFSGLGAAFAAEAPMLVATAGWRWFRQPIFIEPQTTPGRGLAAPPPPPTGPPQQI